MDPLNIKITVYLFFLLLEILVVGSMLRAYLSAAPWCPTRKKDWERVIKITGIKKGDLVYDFGSGTGCVASYIGRKTGATVIGLELSLPFYWWSKIRNIFFGGRNVKIRLKNFFKQDISDANYIFCFLTPRAMEKLGEKFKKELVAGTKVVSYAFKIPNWQPQLVDREGGSTTPIYVYECQKNQKARKSENKS